MGGDAAVVADQVEGEAGGASYQIVGGASASAVTVETTPPPIRSGRPAKVVAAIVWA